MSPTQPYGDFEYGLAGAMNAFFEVLMLYVMTEFIGGLVIAVVGAIFGMLICLVGRSFKDFRDI
jgi:hypothetical protein